MGEVHTTLPSVQVTFIVPPPPGSVDTPVANTIYLELAPVQVSSIDSPDDASGTNSTNGVSANPAPYQPPDHYTQNRSIGQIAPINWTNGSWS